MGGGGWLSAVVSASSLVTAGETATQPPANERDRACPPSIQQYLLIFLFLPKTFFKPLVSF